MVDFQRLAIPIIIVLAIGGIVSFFLAYNFYPKKNVNVNIDGICYELVGSAFDQYRKLETQRSVMTLQLQLDAIEPSNAVMPITFSGTKDEVVEFNSKYKIKMTENTQIGNVDKYVVNGMVQKLYLRQILEDLKNVSYNHTNRTTLDTVGLRPNSFITQEEGRQIARNIEGFMQIGIRQIVENDNISTAECRTGPG